MRKFSLVPLMLALASMATAQTSKDPLLRPRLSKSEQRLKKAGSGSSSGSPVILAPSKTANVDSQLNQLERGNLNASATPTARRSDRPVILQKQGNSSSTNPAVNFQYHQPKATVTTQASTGSRGGKVAVHHGR